MDTCTQCAAELGVGRFCTNCGHPVTAPAAAGGSWRTDTAERPRVTDPPPDAYPDDAEPPRHRGDEARRGAGWVPGVAGLAALILIAGVGVWLLFGGDDEPVLAQDTRTAPTSRGEQSPASTPKPKPKPKPAATRTPEPRPSPEKPTDLARLTRVDAPAPAPTSQDLNGNAVSYVATNLVDGVAETAWRMPGDGTGEAITFRFDSPTVLKEVGLINGYAKVGQDSRGLLDWYAGNRRVLEVEWTFDDGTVVTQPLSEAASMQTIPLKQVRTRSATLRLLAVSPPGSGRASRDYTAISDVLLFGRPITR